MFDVEDWFGASKIKVISFIYTEITYLEKAQIGIKWKIALCRFFGIKLYRLCTL